MILMKFRDKTDRPKIPWSLCDALGTVLNLHFPTLHEHQCHAENYTPTLGPAQQQMAGTDLIFGVLGPWHVSEQQQPGAAPVLL